MTSQIAAKDWTGNKKAVFTTLGASNHSDYPREERDYYATEPKAAELLLDVEKFSSVIWECACGEGHLSKVFEAAGYEVISTDIVYRGYGEAEPFDFLSDELGYFEGDIITNPPYKYALEFVERALEIVQHGQKVAMFLKITFLESKKRKEFYKNSPPHTIYVSSSRLSCARNGDFEKFNSSAACYAWFVWVKGYQGETTLRWIN